MRIVAVAGLVAVLGACQTASYQGDENSPYYVMPVGSRLTLTRDVHIDPDQVATYIQYGKVLSFRDVQKYDPFCKFELYHRIESARTVKPDEINVVRAVQIESFTSFESADAWQFTRTSATRLAQSGGMDSGGPSIIFYTVRMDLQSTKQPEIYRMICGRWSMYPGRYEHVSIAEIRRALDPVFTLQLPGKS